MSLLKSHNQRDKRKGHLLFTFLVIFLITLMERPPLFSPYRYLSTQDLRQGVFLVAAPKLVDPHFHQTVVLLLAYAKGGAIGLIINRPTDIPLEQAIPDLKGIEGLASPLFFGGPVSQNRLFVLFRSVKPMSESQRIFDDIYLTESRTPLDHLLKDSSPQKNLHFYAGYAGWGAGQLDQEVKREDWIILNANPEAIFSEDTSTIWKDLLRRGGEIQVRNFGL